MTKLTENTYEAIDLLLNGYLSESEIRLAIQKGLIDVELFNEVCSQISLEEKLQERESWEETNERAKNTLNNFKNPFKSDESKPSIYPNIRTEYTKTKDELVDKMLNSKDHFQENAKRVQKILKDPNATQEMKDAALKSHKEAIASWQADAKNLKTHLDSSGEKVYHAVNDRKEFLAKAEAAKKTAQEKLELAQAKTNSVKNAFNQVETKQPLEHKEVVAKAVDNKVQAVADTKANATNTAVDSKGFINDFIHNHGSDLKHAGIAGGAILGGVLLHKYLKNKKALKQAHDSAHAVAMNTMRDLHPDVADKAKDHISKEIHNVINTNKDQFKSNHQESVNALTKHFGSKEYANSVANQFK